jgi:hypothetical protein
VTASQRPAPLTPADFGWSGPNRYRDFWDLLADPDGRVPFPQIVSAHWETLSREDRPDLRDEAYTAERAMLRRFESQQGRIQNLYFCATTAGGCALVEQDRGDGRGTVCTLFSSMRTSSTDLALLMGQCETTLADAASIFGSRRSNQLPRIRWIGDAVYNTATRILRAVDKWHVAEDETTRERAVADARAVVLATQQGVEPLFQRAARFRYFGGVLAGAVLALAACVLISCLNARLWSATVSTPALAAATVFGVLGAVTSVFQRTANGLLDIDYLTPRWHLRALAALHPMIGAVLGLVSQFALITALSANQFDAQRRPFELFALIGFAAGFSERFATNIIEKTERSLTNTPGTQALGSAVRSTPPVR